MDVKAKKSIIPSGFFICFRNIAGNNFFPDSKRMPNGNFWSLARIEHHQFKWANNNRSIEREV